MPPKKKQAAAAASTPTKKASKKEQALAAPTKKASKKEQALPAPTKKASKKEQAVPAPTKKASKKEQAVAAPTKKAGKKNAKSTADEAVAEAVAVAVAVAAPPVAAPPPRRRTVDSRVPQRQKFEVVDNYDVLLNQTNVGANNNKYYIIQLLVDTADGQYYTWNRWGRVGEPGQDKLEPCGSLAAATLSFERKFKDKTGCNWADRGSFMRKEGKYGLVEKESEETDGAVSNDAPMGKLSRSQIERGQAVLERLSAAIGGASKTSVSELVQLSSEFFTLIPTNFGRQRPVPITTQEQVNEKDALLKFYLRMGFEEVEEVKEKVSPILGVMSLPVPSSLASACLGICDKASINGALLKAEPLAKSNAGSPIRPVDKELYGAILLYTSNAIYRQLNKALREELHSEIKRFMQYIRLLFHAAGCFEQKATRLWRGISADLSKQYRVNDVVTWWSVSSCTTDRSVAVNFAGQCAESTIVTIDSKTACDISCVTFYSNEKESILLPGTQLKVLSVNKKGKVAEVHLEEVGRAV